ncbi:hypothetical protein [Pseudonocardia hydrocarbonoxydans]|uniref:hypothetical protein n=1 Tax=Pseudonocardia hydrocarbonoxydans TaxID=76726 RepID=UPI001FE8ED25|nr:hypothetical protein [Pseudonocardia hydrocarbonoxydans]
MRRTGDGMQPEWDAQVRDQVVRLVGALRALAPAARPPVAHVDAHDAVLWLDELGCPVGTGPEVLRLRRPAPAPAPPVPPAVAGWVEPPGADLEPPALRDRGPLHGQLAFLVDAPGVRDAHDAWTAAWRPWAHRERARRRQERLADRLTELARLADAPGRELVLAAGLLHLPDAGTHVHVLGQPVAVRTEPGTGDIVCTVTGPPSWEDARTPAPSDPGTCALVTDAVEILAGWGGPACAVDPGWARPSGPDPVLATAPALVVRRTGAVALHRCWDEIDRHVRDTARPLPLGLVQLVREVPPAQRAAWLRRSGAGAVLDAPLLPLPATDDQVRAVAAVGDDTGVVIEGPPGTGKTHAAAALLGALLADGRRVLVTSGDAGSLRVLRDRVPAGLRELCVGPDDGDAVARLAGERTEYDPVHADRRIADLTARRADALRTRDDLRTRIGLLREAEARVYPEIAPGFGGTPVQVARALLATQERDGWVTGDVAGDPPVDDAEFAELLDLLREQTPRHRAPRPPPRTRPAVGGGLRPARRHDRPRPARPSGPRRRAGHRAGRAAARVAGRAGGAGRRGGRGRGRAAGTVRPVRLGAVPRRRAAGLGPLAHLARRAGRARRRRRRRRARPPRRGPGGGGARRRRARRHPRAGAVRRPPRPGCRAQARPARSRAAGRRAARRRRPRRGLAAAHR